jgi:hypothetical protein
MFKREGEEINGWIQKLSKIHFKREGEEINGWIHKHSETLIQERRIGDKWMDSQALPSPCSGEKDGREMDGFTSTRINKHSQTHIQERRKRYTGTWIDSEAL